MFDFRLLFYCTMDEALGVLEKGDIVDFNNLGL